jgi:hypothetical protein
MAHAESAARGRAPLGPRDAQRRMLDYLIQETGKCLPFPKCLEQPRFWS